MKSYRALGAASIVLMLLAALGAALLYGWAHDTGAGSSYAAPLEKAPLEQDPLSHMGDAFAVDEGFTSHLPIVLLDTGGTEPPINGKWVDGLLVPIEGLEPYVEGTLQILDSGTGENRLTDSPAVISRMRIKRRGNTSMMYEKAQWLIKLTTESGQDNEVDLLGMGAENEWVLNGSMTDKSMLRNYLAYDIASQILPFTPDSRYCEVLIKTAEGGYTYGGVYLLIEKIKQGENRVDIQEYKSTDTINSYLVRRDRYDPADLTLDNYSRLSGLSDQYMALQYPGVSRATEQMKRYVEADLSAIEKILYSDDPAVFATYPDVIDVDSFVDYFLVNEFFANYDAGIHSTYFYKDVGGKLTMGPVWDFDGAMDNYKYEVLQIKDLAFQTKPWFDRLCLDEDFLKKLEARYTELRQSVLSEKNIIATIDEIVAYLGGAQQREWARWGHWYTQRNVYSLLDAQEEDCTVIQRETSFYEDEIYRIKTVLRDHGNNIYSQLVQLEDDVKFHSGGVQRWMGWLLVLAAATFFIPALFVNYRK